MERAKDYFSTLQSKANSFISNLKKPPQIINVSRKCKGGTTRIESLRVVYGHANQAQLVSRYSGLQCTTMALSAIVHWYSQDYRSQFTPYDINLILREGNDLHTRLRRTKTFSRIRDGMIGISDVPNDRILRLVGAFDKDIGVRLQFDSIPVFLSQHAAVAGLLSLENFIEFHEIECPNVAFLVTIKCYSYAIIRSEYEYHLFDSHGHLRLQEKNIIDRGLMVSFPNLQTLVAMLQGMYGLGAQCDVAPVVCCSFAKKPLTSRTHRMFQGLRQSSTQPRPSCSQPRPSCSYTNRPTNRTSQAPRVNPIFRTKKASPPRILEDNGDSPFVGLMGGW